MAPEADHAERMSLSRSTCLDLLGDVDFARVVISVRCLPVALPTRIALVNDDHLILTSTDKSVAGTAENGDVLSVQIDGLNNDGSTWSVMVSGIASPAAPSEHPPPSLARALERGATLLSLPLTLVAGERVT